MCNCTVCRARRQLRATVDALLNRARPVPECRCSHCEQRRAETSGVPEIARPSSFSPMATRFVTCVGGPLDGDPLELGDGASACVVCRPEDNVRAPWTPPEVAAGNGRLRYGLYTYDEKRELLVWQGER